MTVTAARIDRMPAAKRCELVRVAAEEFGAAGYDGASLNKIIRTCGLSKSSFYYFVPSKSDLFDLVVRDLMSDVAATFEPPTPAEFAGEKFWLCVETIFGDLIQISQHDEAFMLLGRVFYKEAPEDATRGITTALTAAWKWLENVLVVGRDSGEVRTDLPEDLQNQLVFTILRVFDEWTLSHYDDLSPTDLSALATEQFATLRRILDPAG